jgi:hypothetical protein
MKIYALSVVILASVVGATAQGADMLTHHNNNSRTGWNAAETRLKPANVNSATFGKRFSHPVDGYVYAQPLYLSGVSIPGKGEHNVVYVATEHDSVYAFDADDATGINAQPLWFRTFIGSPALGTVISPVPSADIGCFAIVPEIGITATPVIDPATGTLYVEAWTKVTAPSGTTYPHHLHALDVATGAEKFGGPVEIQASVPGTGGGSVGGVVTFNPRFQLLRPALLLSNGVVYLASASNCDLGTYHGWVLGYDAATLAQTSVYCTTPNAGEGGVWMSGEGLAADGSGHLFFQTGNGEFDADTGGSDFGQSVVQLTSGLAVVDYFTPFNWSVLNVTDTDVGSGGVLLLPDQPGAHPHLSVSAGKEGKIYLVDRDNMGHFNSGSDHVVQTVDGDTCFTTPALFGSLLYYGFGPVAAYSLTNGLLSTSPVAQTSVLFPFPHPTVSVSSNGSQDGIVWAIRKASPAVLHAFDAANVATELYNSDQAGSRDQPGGYVKFTSPTVVNGKVYVGTQTELAVYGLFPSQAGLDYFTLPPCRVADTRGPTDPYGGPALAANADRSFVIGGQCGIPPGAQAVAFNFTVTEPTAAGHLQIVPGAMGLPLVSTANYDSGQTRANNGIVALGPSGDILVHVGQASGTVHLIIDVSGYFE